MVYLPSPEVVEGRASLGVQPLLYPGKLTNLIPELHSPYKISQVEVSAIGPGRKHKQLAGRGCRPAKVMAPVVMCLEENRGS